MKGIVFNLLEDIVRRTHGEDALVDAGECPPGVDALLSKPVTRQALRGVLSSILRQRG